MLVDFERCIVRLKVVYYGIAQSGKTTNLEKLSEFEGLGLTKIDTKEERTLVFDFATKKVKVGDLTLSFALYTIPGQDIYRDIRLTVLRGVDGVVFVVDAQREKLEENINFYSLLKADLMRLGKDWREVPTVLQYNKMDLPNVMDYKELEYRFNVDKLPSVCASAIKGEGVVETFKLLEDYLVSRVERLLS